jgi:hypothetical protein
MQNVRRWYCSGIQMLVFLNHFPFNPAEVKREQLKYICDGAWFGKRSRLPEVELVTSGGWDLGQDNSDFFPEGPSVPSACQDALMGSQDYFVRHLEQGGGIDSSAIKRNLVVCVKPVMQQSLVPFRIFCNLLPQGLNVLRVGGV